MRSRDLSRVVTSTLHAAARRFHVRIFSVLSLAALLRAECSTIRSLEATLAATVASREVRLRPPAAAEHHMSGHGTRVYVAVLRRAAVRTDALMQGGYGEVL